MALTAQEQQELDDLELAELEVEEQRASGGANRSVANETKSPHSALEAAATGSAQATSLGYTPQIVGGITAGINKVQDYVNPVSDLQGGTIPRMGYTEARDRTTKDIDAQRAEHPLAYMGGNVVGSMVPGLAAGKAVQGMNTIKGGALSGAALAGLSNPGDREGVVNNPLDGEFQLGDRAVNTAIGGGTGLAMGGLSALIGKGAKHAQDFRDLKTGKMADRAVSAIDDAASAINEKQIAPRDQQLRELIKGKTYEVNPDRVAPVFPKLASKMSNGLDDIASPQGLSVAGGPQAQAPARVQLSGERALRLKRGADMAADHAAATGAFDPASKVANEEALSLANIIRRQMNADPSISKVNSEIGQMSDLRSALTKRESSAPIETLIAPLGSSRHAVLSKVDQAAGSKLLNLAEDIQAAKGLELNHNRLLKPLEFLDEARKTGLRGAAEGSRVLNKAPVGTKETLTNALTPTRRVK